MSIKRLAEMWVINFVTYLIGSLANLNLHGVIIFQNYLLNEH